MNLIGRLLLLGGLLFIGFPSARISAAAASSGSHEMSSDCAKKVSWIAKAGNISDRLKLLVSLLDRHPNIVTANLSFKRSLIETYAHIAELQKHLGNHGASFETTPPTIGRARYVATGEAQYNVEAIKKFLEGRVEDVQNLELLDGGDLATQIRAFKRDPRDRKADGSVDEKAFIKKVRKLLQIVPFVFNSDGKPQFASWMRDREGIITQIRAGTPQDLENRYGDLLKEHLEKQIDAISQEKGLGQVKIIYENLRNQFLGKDLKSALTPISRDGGVAEERTLSVETVPAWVAIVRGCYGGDCSILSVPYYALVKGAKAHFIRKSHDLSEQPSGYGFSVPVEVNGKNAPYSLTINGVTLTQVDVEIAERLIAEDYGTSDVVLPDFKAHRNLVNTDAARTGLTMSKRKAVKVKFPPGWAIVDAYMKEHQVSGYTNYYLGSSVEDAYLSTLPPRDPRVLETSHEEASALSYREVKDLLQIPLIQRAILGVQALTDNSDGVRTADIQKILNLSETQIQAARPLIELSSTRALSLKEYRLAQEELGLNLQSLLDLEPMARAATLRSLYLEFSPLFTEHKVRNNPKAINALIDVYGANFAEEIRTILREPSISDDRVLLLLKTIKPRLSEGDLESIYHFAKEYGVTRSDAQFDPMFVQSFIRSNPADTALGRKLEAGFHSGNPGIEAFALAIAKSMSARTSQMLQAFQEISRNMEIRKLNFGEARDQWLSDEKGSVQAKARYLGKRLIVEIPSAKVADSFDRFGEFKKLFDRIPESQKKQVEEAIDGFSSFRVFTGITREALENEKSEKSIASKPGIIRRLLGREESVAKSPSPNFVPDNLKLESFEFVDAPIPEGGAKFMMGSPPNEPGRYNSETQREVILTEPFQAQVTPVIQWQWEKIMGSNPSRFSGGDKSRNRPVEKVSWEESQVFIQKLNQLDPKWNYRLLTEAEWEFMTRAGTTSAYSFGNDVADLKEHAHFSENSGSETHYVTEKFPNPWGMYDTHGNVWEWVSDWYGEALEGGENPRGPDTGSYRVVRGGSWGNDARGLRSAQRGSDPPGIRGDSVGLRLARTPK